MKHFCLAIAALLLLSALPASVLAWPADGDWNPVPRGFSYLSDPQSDAIGNDARDIVGNGFYPVSYVFNDGNYIYYRMRVDTDPRASLITGEFRPFGWGFLLDTNNNTDDYEFMVMIDGIANPEVMYLARNTVQGAIGDASDKAEIILWQENLNYNNNYRVISAGSIFPTAAPTEDFFVDWRIPFDVFKTSLGLSDNSLIRYFVGSANNAMVLNADLCEGSGNTSLSLGLSNFVLPSGEEPATGSAQFVTSLDGSGDLTEFYAGSTLYIKVVDPDENAIKSTAETISVFVSSPSGDSQTITLTETGPDTGIFTGTMATSDGTPASDEILQVSPIEIITVTYIDYVDAGRLYNQNRIDTARALPAADLAISKTADKPTANEGETVQYSITVTNNGPSAATGIQVTDLLPTGLTYVSDNGGGAYNPVTGLWMAGSLSKNLGRTLMITATVKSGTANTSIINTASRTASAQPDPVSSNNSASATVSVAGADLSIDKTASTVMPPVGGTVTFTISVTNLGSYTATGVAVTDLLPAMQWTNIAASTVSQGTYNADSGVWDVGTLATGTAATLQISAQLLGSIGSGTVLTNTASVTHSDQADPNSANNSKTVTLAIDGVDLSVSKTVTTPTPDEGDNVIFSITLNNNATSARSATNITVNDLLPAGLTYVSHTISPTGADNYNPNTGNWNNVSVARGGSAILSITARVDTGTAGQTLVNTARVTSLAQTDITTGNHSASASVTVRHTNISVVKTVDNAYPGNNQNVVFTITVQNHGPNAASNLTIFDQLPGQVIYQSHTAGQTYSTTTNLWTIGNLAVGATAQLQITALVSLKNNQPNSFFNTAYLNSCAPGDSNRADNTSSVVLTVSGTDLMVTKTMETGYTSYPASGTQTRFRLTVTNYGPNAATGVRVDDLVPAGLSCDGASNLPAGTSFTNNGNNCYWSVGNLAVGASLSMTLHSTVSAATGTMLTNRANVSPIDGNAGNNTATQILYVGATDLAISKTVSNPTPSVGAAVNYTITVSNNGTNSVSGVTVKDMPPAGIVFGIPSTANGTYSVDAITGEITWNIGTIPYPGNAILIIPATISASAAGATVTNTARITAAGATDPISTNDSASVSLTVQSADVYVNKSANKLNPYVGSSTTFTIEVGNNGPHPVTNLVIDDLLPNIPPAGTAPAFTIVSPPVPSQGTYNSSTGEWQVGTLAKAQTATLTIAVTVNAGTNGINIVNTASKRSADQYDPNNTNNSQSVTLTPRLLTIDLALDQQVATATPVEGSNVVFTLTLYNLHSSETATGVTVIDTLPANLAFLTATSSAGSLTSVPAVGSSGNIIWALPSLGPLSNVELLITARTVCGSFGTTLTNTAAITTAGQIDPNAANDTDTVGVVPTAAPPSLTVLKSASTAVASPGQVLLYTVQVNNTGCGKATNVIVQDHMSPYTAWQLDYNSNGAPDEPFDFVPGSSGLTLAALDFSRNGGALWGETPASENGGAPIGYDGTITNWKIEMGGEMPPGGNFTLRYRARVK